MGMRQRRFAFADDQFDTVLYCDIEYSLLIFLYQYRYLLLGITSIFNLKL